MGRTINLDLDVDISDLQGIISRMQMAMSPAQFDRAMYGIFKSARTKFKRILQSDIPKRYEVTSPMVGKAVGEPKIRGAGCSIPIKGGRLSMGRKSQSASYSATGGAKGWESLHKKYRVKPKIVKGKRGVLPERMSKIGNKPPFINTTAKSLNGITFTRETKKRLPIRKVVGVAIPQMPLWRSRDDVIKDIHDYMADRIQHRMLALIKYGR